MKCNWLSAQEQRAKSQGAKKISSLVKTSGKEYVGGVLGLQEQIQQIAKEEAPCHLYVGMVSRLTTFIITHITTTQYQLMLPIGQSNAMWHCKWHHLVGKIVTNASGNIWWLNL